MINDFFIVKKLDIKLEIAAAKSSHTYAKMQHKLRHLRRQYPNFSWSFLCLSKPKSPIPPKRESNEMRLKSNKK